MERNLVVFRFSLLAVICLTSVSLAFAEAAGEGGFFPAVLSIPIAFFTLVMTDRKEAIVLSPTVAAFFGFAALIASATEFTTGIEARILSGAHLITYFQWIFLFQRKSVGIYWWLIALSLLQMAVASVLTNNVWFGIGMLLFLFSSIWTLANFSIYRARLRVGKSFKTKKKIDTAASSQNGPTESRSKKSGSKKTRQIVSPYLRKSLSSVRGSVHVVPGESWINSRFVMGTLLLTCLSTLIGFIFYTATPRVWLGRVQFPSDSEAALTPQLSGFSDTVRLGEMGSILESEDPVFSVTFRDSKTDKTLNVERVFQEYGYVEPMFRGASKERYRNKSWTTLEPGFASRVEMRFAPIPGQFSVRQDYEIEDIGTTTLFAMQPVIGGVIENGRARTQISLASDSISPPDAVSYVANYSLLTAEPQPTVNGHVVVPMMYRDTAEYYRRHRFLEKLVSMPGGSLTRLREFAQDLVRKEEERRERDLSIAEKAFLLESHLRDSGNYGYTLDQTIIDDSIDPVEDFLFNRKQGHCQYYAASLALMLRSVGIPSRYINGFKGGTWNERRQQYDVQQRHAHAWVEAFDPSVPGWIVLDATPAGRADSVNAVADSQDPVRNAFGFAENFWQNNILNLTLQKQQAQIYTPIYNRIRETWDRTQSTRMVLYSLWDYVVEVLTSPDKLLSLQGLTLILTLLTVIGILAWVLPKLYRRIVKSGSRLLFSSNQRRHRRMVEFYERFLALLNQHHIRPTENATPREYAEQVSVRLKSQLEQSDLSDFPERITNAYYLVRFGERTISDAEVNAFGECVDRLSDALIESPDETHGTQTAVVTDNSDVASIS